MAAAQTGAGTRASHGTVKTTRAPRVTSGSIQMSPPWASTKALAMARPRPALPPPPFWLNISKTRSRSSRGDARTLVGHGDLDPVAALPGAVRAVDADDAVVGGEPLGVLEHVGQDLADQDVVEVQQGQAGRCVDR